MSRFLAISLGAVLGANARYWVSSWIDRALAVRFPVGTMVINCTGSLILAGFVVIATERLSLPQEWRLAVAVGFLGSYTTFSTFSVETWRLMESGNWALATANVVVSVIAGVAGAWLGSQAARVL
ncbi:MAG: fluoride efflux transporter CrcB [Anaerolineae bacterium]